MISRRWQWTGAMVVGFVLFALVVGRLHPGNSATREGGATVLRVDGSGLPPTQAPARETFRAAVRATLPTLAFVQVEALPPAAEAGPFPFRRFGDPPSTPRVGSGSGFVLTPDGYILTNNHVVQDAVSVTIALADNRRLEAAVIGRDPDTDIAVLRVDADSLKPAILGNSDSLEVGDWVLALGYPLGLSLTVTAGIVSGTGRSLGITERDQEAVAPIENFIQTDAAINPGNSGGPLVDLAGRVVGVNSAIASPTGFYSGYGFAVPINLARRVADDLIRFGQVRRPRLGLRLSDVTPADAEVYGLRSVAGVEVAAVDPGAPAARAGVQLGDVVIALDSAPVRSAGDLQSLVAERRPGDTVRLGLVRYGQALSATVTLGQFPARARTNPVAARHDGPAGLGFTAAETRLGIVVDAVDRYSPAARAGVRPGQVIVALNRRAVRSAADFEAALRTASQAGVLSLRVRDPDVGETIINYQLQPTHAGR